MAYTSNNPQKTDNSPTVGVLVTNLGSPDAPTRQAVRPYLKQFLSDPRVVEAPRLLWWFVLNLIILNTRPARSAAAYLKVWTDQGAPLLVNTKAQCEALQQELGEDIAVDLAMRYGNPSINERIQSLLDRGVEKLLILPLYPQYSGPTTGSTFDALAADFSGRRWIPELRFVGSYYSSPHYIQALAGSITAYRREHGSAEKLLFSYHGEPKSYYDKGDPYYEQCLETTLLVAESLSLADSEYETTFQSRFGPQEWLQPYTDERLRQLPGEGARSVQVICPGFSADCLETLEEIGIENRDTFLSAGGASYGFIPCLNASPGHIDALAAIVRENLAGWI